MAKSAYIHIPFCAHKCDFCDFAAFAGVDELSFEYCQVVVGEIRDRIAEHPNEHNLSSLFYGGGTPGYIDPAQLAIVHNAVLEHVGIEEDAEVTLETTPQSVTAKKAKAWRAMGFNRISIGVQSFDDAELKAMGRDHTADQAKEGISNALEGGFTNVALDLMYGVPEQTVKSWHNTLQTAIGLGLPHMSAYGLTIAGNSPLLQRYPRDSAAYPDEDNFVDMYKELIDSCSKAGLQQYEVSNFSKPGYESKHNLSYWTNDEYLAFGVSAHRYVNSVRSSNFRSLNKYMREPTKNETHEVIDETTRAKEAIFLGLRMRRGLNLKAFSQRYGIDLETVLSAKMQRLSDGGFITIEDGWLKLSQSGVLISNLVLAELV